MTIDAAALLQGTTPGPWRIYRNMVSDPSTPTAESIQNARLIAAAPDLANEVIRLRDALAKITALDWCYAESGVLKALHIAKEALEAKPFSRQPSPDVNIKAALEDCPPPPGWIGGE